MSARDDAVARCAALLAAWNARDLDAFVALLAEDVWWHDLGMLHPPVIGRDAVRRFGELVLRAFPDFAYELRGPVCVAEDGSACLVPFTVTATNSGPYDPPGLAPTGRRVQFDGLDYLRFRDGLVAHIETRFDVVDAAGQLTGLSLRPAEGSFLEGALVRAERVLAAWARSRTPPRPSEEER